LGALRALVAQRSLSTLAPLCTGELCRHVVRLSHTEASREGLGCHADDGVVFGVESQPVVYEQVS